MTFENERAVRVELDPMEVLPLRLSNRHGCFLIRHDADRLLLVFRMRGRPPGLGFLAVAAVLGWLVYSEGVLIGAPPFGATGLWWLAFGYPVRSSDGLTQDGGGWDSLVSPSC